MITADELAAIRLIHGKESADALAEMQKGGDPLAGQLARAALQAGFVIEKSRTFHPRGRRNRGH